MGPCSKNRTSTNRKLSRFFLLFVSFPKKFVGILLIFEVFEKLRRDAAADSAGNEYF